MSAQKLELNVNVKEKSETSLALINKISAAVGCWYEPKRIRREAKAKGEALKAEALARMEVLDIKTRATQRRELEAVRHQMNIEAIAQKAVETVLPSGKPEEINDDWAADFFEKCRNVSDETMRGLWSRVLAGEANAQGSFRKRTLSILADLEKSDADMFANLCRFVVHFIEPIPIIFGLKHEIYHERINAHALEHLQSLDLISFHPDDRNYSFTRHGIFEAKYFERGLLFHFSGSDTMLPVGSYSLTQPGLELSRLCCSQPINGFLEFLMKIWSGSAFGIRESNGVAGWRDDDAEASWDYECWIENRRVAVKKATTEIRRDLYPQDDCGGRQGTRAPQRR